MEILVVTGGLKSRKTTFMRYLEKHGELTIGCDEIIALILKFIGLDKKTVLRYFFSHTLYRKMYLSLIIHTMVIILISKIIFGTLMGHSRIFIEVPLLYEYKLNNLFYNIVVYTTPKIQMQRIKQTGVSSRFLEMQISLEYKRQKADFVIETPDNVNTFTKDVLRKKSNLNIYQIVIICIFIYSLY